MSECICIYIYICVPYIFPDGMSETMSEYIVCQGGDRSKKVCFSWHILTLTHPHFEKNLCLSDLAAQATICNSRHLMSCRNSPVTAVEARSSFTNLWLLPKWSMQPCTCEKLKESSFTLDSIDWFPKKRQEIMDSTPKSRGFLHFYPKKTWSRCPKTDCKLPLFRIAGFSKCSWW